MLRAWVEYKIQLSAGELGRMVAAGRHCCGIGGTGSLYIDKSKAQGRTSIQNGSPGTYNIEDASVLYLYKGSSESIKDHGTRGPNRMWL